MGAPPRARGGWGGRELVELDPYSRRPRWPARLYTTRRFGGFAAHFARRLRRHRPEVMDDLERRGVVSAAEYERADSDGEDDEHEGFRL